MPIDKEKLKTFMIDKKMNISDLSKISNVSKSQISRLIKEDTKTTRLDTLGKIAEALGVNYEDLLKE